MFSSSVEKSHDFLIRAARPGEEEILYQLICELAEYEKKDLSTLPLTKEKLHRFGFSKNPYFRTDFVEAEGDVVGYALYYYGFSANQGHPTLYLEDLYVKPTHRNRGIGTKLLEQLICYAKERECCRVEWHVFAWNEPAIAFYEQIGGTLKKDLLLVRLENKDRT